MADPGSNPDKSARSNEFPATSAVLLAAAFMIEDSCKDVNDNFMRCKRDRPSAADCIEQGEDVNECVHNVFERIKHSPCQKLFERFWKCLDMNNQDFIYCRDEEIAFHLCAKENLGLTKRLWRGLGPQHGFKEENELPGHDSWRFRYHVWNNKR